MRLFLKTTITIFLLLSMAPSHRSTALSNLASLPITEINELDAFVKSEETHKDTLIFSHVLPPSVKTIVLDAGHGGKDRGCKGHSETTKEKEIALAITLKLGKYIESYFPDVRVIYTRKEDVFVTLNRRARIANENNADLFISIHCNYIRKRPDVRGSETYVMGLHTADHNLNVAMRENAAIAMEDNFQKGYNGYNPDSPESHIMLSMFQNAYLERSILFAELVEQQIPKSSKGKHPSRGVRQAGFLVLKATAMPSVLVESGYLSHEKDEAYLRTGEGQKDVAFAIFKAFSIYKNIIEGNDNGTPEVVSIVEKDEIATEVVKIATEVEKKEEVKASPTVDKPLAEDSRSTAVQKPLIPNRKISVEGIEYMIQLAATPIELDIEKSKYAVFANDIVVRKIDDLYKYLVPVGAERKEASAALEDFKAKGFPKAFLSVYQGDKRIQILYK